MLFFFRPAAVARKLLDVLQGQSSALKSSSRRNASDVAPAHMTMMFPAVSSKVWASDSLPRARTGLKKQSKSFEGVFFLQIFLCYGDEG